jgi:hypothetical protein
MKTPREKYYNDPDYKILVDFMVNQMKNCKYTPSEMREAATLASIIYYETREPQYAICPLNKELEALENWVNKE